MTEGLAAFRPPHTANHAKHLANIAAAVAAFTASAVQPKSGPRRTGPLYSGVSAMRSKLLQKITYSQTHQSDEMLADQQENTQGPSEPLDAAPNRATRSTWLLMPRSHR